MKFYRFILLLHMITLTIIRSHAPKKLRRADKHGQMIR